MRTRHAVVAAGLAVLALLGAACSDDGKTLRPPAPGATAPPIATTTTQGVSSGDGDVIAPASALVVASTAFLDGGLIPPAFTCDSPNAVSPPLSWTGIPTDAAEIAIVVTDSDAARFVHWVVSGLSPDLLTIAAGGLPEGTVELTNDGGTVGWYAPCPPPGSGEHHYVFTVYALANPINLSAGGPAKAGIQTIVDASIAAATLTGRYQRAG